MRPALTVGLLGAAALTAGILVVRQRQDPTPDHPRTSDASHREMPATKELSLDRLRERGF